MPRYFTQFGGRAGGGKTATRADDDWYSRPLLADLYVPEHQARETGLVDARGRDILRAPNPMGFGKDDEW